MAQPPPPQAKTSPASVSGQPTAAEQVTLAADAAQQVSATQKIRILTQEVNKTIFSPSKDYILGMNYL